MFLKYIKIYFYCIKKYFKKLFANKMKSSIFPEPDFHKNMIESFKFLDFIESNNDFVLSDSMGRLKNKSCKIKKQSDQLEIEFNINYDEDSFDYEINDVEIKNKDITLFATKIIVTNKIGTEEGFKVKGHINYITSKEFGDDEEFYFRLIIPVRDNLSFENYIASNLSVENNYMKNGKELKCHNLRCLLPINLNDNNYHFYIIKPYVIGETYILIESLEKQNYKDFYQCVHCIILSFGFITGELPLDQGYFILSDDFNFKTDNIYMFRTIYKSITTAMPVINTNNIGFSSFANLTKEDLRLKMNLLSMQEFNNICSALCVNENLIRAINLYLEANTQEIFVRCALFSVAIETLALVINNENPTTKERFLPDDKLWLEFRSELLKVHDIYKDEIRKKLTTQNDVFESGINNLNRLGTTALLFNPFHIYNITLNNDDKNALNYRNKFLHGENPFLSEKNIIEGRTKFDMTYYFSLRLHTLFVKLFLKHLKYKGYILNYVRLHEHIHSVDTGEAPFLKI